MSFSFVLVGAVYPVCQIGTDCESEKRLKAEKDNEKNCFSYIWLYDILMKKDDENPTFGMNIAKKYMRLLTIVDIFHG